VEDEPALRAFLLRSLRKDGFEVEGTENGVEAIDLCRQTSFDVVATDLQMPGMDGLEFLRRVREHDLDLPVILMTGAPSIESAADAVAYGALRYLTKPFDIREFVDAIQYGIRIRKVGLLQREAGMHMGHRRPFPGDRAGLEARFARALNGVWMAYQPIVSWSRRNVFAYEALLRSTEPTLPEPLILLEVAERLGRLHDLGRTIRSRVAEGSRQAMTDTMLFVNLHPDDLRDDELFSANQPLVELATRVVLEITERASLEGIQNTRARIAALRTLGFRVAVDDLGAGYSGLASMIQLEPDVVKLDISLIRGIDAEPTKQRLVGSMCQLCRDMGITVVAEGIENVAERNTVVELGCDLLQGYVFARPERHFAQPAWAA